VTQTQTVLCINTGSSSLKFHLYEMGSGEELLARGALEGIGTGHAGLRFVDASGTSLAERDLGGAGHHAALAAALDLMSSADLPSVEAVGHRIVHGGPTHLAPERLTPALAADLATRVAWAPLHLPASLEVIGALTALHPGLPQVACFDTAFHAAIPEIARRLALPRTYFDQGVRKYGFHGLSYEYVMAALGPLARGRTVVAHLGNGASMVACLDGTPVDTTMGMTPMGGFMMGTRSGDLDPGVLLYLIRQGGGSAGDLERLLDEQSGLLGVSGETSDMRALLELAAAGNASAAQAVDMFCYQARRTVGSLAAVLGGLDRLVFTGGIGENAPRVRLGICQGLEHLGISLDAALNDAGAAQIGVQGSPCQVLVTHTNEDLMIARHTYALVFGAPSPVTAPGAHDREGAEP
jgi:acetate kinase